ncbi:hypothetical protein [Nocardia brasiliensis]|uniref:hypothetical protein n=1 Tax=Nocardia brasiliensis TaxID=37326 RepID=UPI0024549211|nr:hypothetical protein [Nocardia brasiliensis]
MPTNDDAEARQFVMASLSRFARNAFDAVLDTAVATGTVTAAQAAELTAVFETQMAAEEQRAAARTSARPRAGLRSVPTPQEQ